MCMHFLPVQGLLRVTRVSHVTRAVTRFVDFECTAAINLPSLSPTCTPPLPQQPSSPPPSPGSGLWLRHHLAGLWLAFSLTFASLLGPSSSWLRHCRRRRSVPASASGCAIARPRLAFRYALASAQILPSPSLGSSLPLALVPPP